jgi:fibronectin type 3 domain-containing protein
VLSWNKVDGAVKYQIYRSTAQNGTYTLINTVTGTSTTNKNAVAGKTYFYKVVAVHSNANANSAYSTVVSITSK